MARWRIRNFSNKTAGSGRYKSSRADTCLYL